MNTSINLARENMLKQQFRTMGVLDENLLALLARVPRECFVPKRYEHLAFADTNLPLGHGQNMLKPQEEARILQALNIQSSERVLEIGTGSGYFTALLASVAKHVESVDIYADFISEATSRLAEFSYHNVMLNTADAALGYKKNTHYDVIVITGALPVVPKSYFQQLAKGGRLFAFVGGSSMVEAVLWTRTENADNPWQMEKLFETLVAPLVNAVEPHAFVF